MKLENQIIDNLIFLYLDASIYSRDALMKCFYWYADKFDISINKNNENYFEIKLKPLPNFEIDNKKLEGFFSKIKQDIIDFNLRDIVTKETKNIRDLLIAKAFSHFDTEEPPPEASND